MVCRSDGVTRAKLRAALSFSGTLSAETVDLLLLGRRGVAELGLWRRWRADSGNVYVLVLREAAYSRSFRGSAKTRTC